VHMSEHFDSQENAGDFGACPIRVESIVNGVEQPRKGQNRAQSVRVNSNW
jgi:hypothetical protein